jgi:SpoVK/Ycf46/Vps4 family AAA+-type ATPase
MTAGAAAEVYRNNFEHLEDELRWLDLLIRLRVRTLALQNQVDPESQAARTVYITPAEVEWLLETETPKIDDASIVSMRAGLERLRIEIDGRVAQSLKCDVFLGLPQLGNLFGLSWIERQAIVICLAPELRRKYDRLYAYLQDDITRKRPSVDLVLELLCETESQRWRTRGLLSDSAALLRAGLVRKANDSRSPSGSSGLGQLIELDARVCQFLLGGSQMDDRLSGHAQFHRPSSDVEWPAASPAILAGVESLIAHYLAPQSKGSRKLVLHLHGPQGAGKRELALHVCRQLGGFLLSIDTELLLARGPEGEGLLRNVFREGLMQQAFVYVENAEALLREDARPLLRALHLAITEFGWLIFLSSNAPWTHKRPFTNSLFHSVELPVPDVPVRAAVWERCLEEKTPEAITWAPQLAAQFRLTAGQIRSAVELAQTGRLTDPKPSALSLSGLAAACRAQSNQKLRELAIRIEPHYGWDDLVLPPDKLAHLREICDQFRHQYRVFGTWGFGKKLGHGKGLSVLFTGASGTGKTMAAQVLARELELELYKVDLAGVVSKYIGETEKNLSRIFGEAETSNAILFFDEADALFGKRTEVSDAHDRYANIETSYLLQRMEEYEGVVILATNLSENMDAAFTRRIRFVVEFPFPNEANRLSIWKAHFPAEVPISPEVDCEYLAREIKVSGGNIKNIALNAAFLAASDGGMITLGHILHGTRREYEKMGKLWNDPVAAGLPRN